MKLILNAHSFFFWWSKEISLEDIKKMQGKKLQQKKGFAHVQEFSK